MSTVIPTPTDSLLNYETARKKLGDVPQSTFLSWIRKGILKPVKIGPRRSFIRSSDLDALMKAS